MLYLEQKRNRLVLMIMSILVSAAIAAILIDGINAVGVLLVTLIINIFVYYALPGRYSKSFTDRHSGHR